MSKAADALKQWLEQIRQHQHGYRIVHERLLPASDGEFQNIEFSAGLKATLDFLEIPALYRHQAEALERFRAGDDLVISTPTASGKTLTYTLPLLELLEEDPESRALFMFPLKSLEQDQLLWFHRVSGSLHFNFRSDVYDGDTTPYRRRAIRSKLPQVLISNPDMLHYTLLAKHGDWRRFWERLRLVVLDEVHVYRGIFGAHVMHILKRLQRVAAYYGAQPRFIMSSATVDNVAELGESLTGRPVTAVTRSGGKQSARRFLLVNPTDEVPFARVSLYLFLEAVRRGVRTILFTQSRRLTESIYANLERRERKLAGAVRVYRAGFLSEERRQVEQELKQGKIVGVISTSALELGIDVGGLDLCILAGYPGTMISTWQRAGRVGRAGSPAAVVLVAGQNALDQYFMRVPQRLFAGQFEKAIIGVDNAPITRDHLVCAAAEVPLTEQDPQYPLSAFSQELAQLVEAGKLIPGAAGKRYFARPKRPQLDVRIRSIGQSFSIINPVDGKLVGTVSHQQALTECHPGAVYLHMGRQYLVEKLDLINHRVSARPGRADYYTQVTSEKELEVISVLRERPWRNLQVYEGEVRVRTTITGYQKRKILSRELISTHSLDLPPGIMETRGIWLRLPPEMETALLEAGEHFMGSIHAVEHAGLALTPLHALCDRGDVGGISVTYHPDVDDAAIFFYDGYPGGIGIMQRMYDLLDEWLPGVRTLIAECPCEDGCPACIQSPRCGSGNRPLSKTGAVMFLDLVLEGKIRRREAMKPVRQRQEPTGALFADHDLLPELTPVTPEQLQNLWQERRVLIFDLETQLSAKDVGGWQNAYRMRLSAGVTYDMAAGSFQTWTEEDVDEMIAALMQADMVVGYNTEKFDFNVLKGYLPFGLEVQGSLDLLPLVRRSAGRAIKLDAITSATLGTGKSADGLQALKWWKEGRLDAIIHYCRQDVDVTRRLFEHLLLQGFFRLPGREDSIPLNIRPHIPFWSDPDTTDQ